jgi:predicted RNA-binding protein with PUA-like domain
VNYWLMKSEPDVFALDDLKRSPGGTAPWDGVRNYQARNFIREMRPGDLVFFYHSSCVQPGIVGVMEIAGQPYPDVTAFDSAAEYYDPKSRPENPRWYAIDVRYKRTLKRTIPLSELKLHPRLASMALLRRGNRLSVMPVSPVQWRYIQDLERA